MNTSELVEALAARNNITKANAKQLVTDFVGIVVDMLKKEEKVQIGGLGVFSTVTRAERKGINPKTKERITIPARTALKFKPAKELKESMKK